MKMQTQEMNVDFQEKDIMNDLLSSMKKLTSDYNAFANEAAHTNLKQDLLDILREEHESESMIFEEMNQRGWYETPAASSEAIRRAKEYFVKLDKKYNL